jgi:imidazolonepropionase-like amidohydrolase
VKTLLRGPIHGVKGADGVLVDGEAIAWVGRGQPPERPDEEIVAAPGELIAPGFVDLQVNGFAGHDAAAGAGAIAAISARDRRHGFSPHADLLTHRRVCRICGRGRSGIRIPRGASPGRAC